MGYFQEECVKAEHPDNYDAELLLRLYDLRRSQIAAGAGMVYSRVPCQFL